jgi:hypothetical protein
MIIIAMDLDDMYISTNKDRKQETLNIMKNYIRVQKHDNSYHGLGHNIYFNK